MEHRAQQIIAEYNERIYSLINQINANNRTNNQISAYEEENVSALESKKSLVLWVYYMLAIYTIILMWTSASISSISSKVMLTILISFYPSYVWPVQRFIQGWLEWLRGLIPYNVNSNLRAV